MLKSTISLLVLLFFLPFKPSAITQHLDSIRNELLQHNDNYTPNDYANYYYQEYSSFKELDSISLYYSTILKNTSQDQYIKNELARAIILNNLSHSQEAIAILSRLAFMESVYQDKKRMNVIYNTSGNIHDKLGNSEKARGFYRLYQESAAEENNLRGVKGSFINIGNTFFNSQEYDSARYYYEQAKELEKAGEMSHYASLLNNLTTVYVVLEESDKALKNYEELALMDDLNPNFKIVVFKNYAELLSRLGRFDEAIVALEKANLVAQLLDDSYYHSILLRDQSIYYSNKNRHKEAYESLWISDSLLNQNIKLNPEDEMESLIIDHKNELLEKENIFHQQSLLNTERRAARLSVFVIVLIILSVLIIFLLVRSKKLFKSVDQKNKELSVLNETLDVFNAHVSHDLKTTLNNTQAMSFMIEKYNENGDQQKVAEINKRIIDINKNGKKTIDGFIEMGKVGSFAEKQKTRILNPSAEITTILHNNGLDEAIDLEIESKEIDAFTIGETAFESIFLNFFSNTIKYNQNRPTASIKFISESKMLKIIYSDNGIGIDMDKDGEALFTPYKRIANEINSQGTGIGLFMVRKIILQHGGKIKAESKLGQGLRFIITLPIK